MESSNLTTLPEESLEEEEEEQQRQKEEEETQKQPMVSAFASVPKRPPSQ